MIVLYYFTKYVIIMLLAHFISVFGISSIYELPVIVLFPLNYLAIAYAIKHPLEKRKDIEYKQLLKYLLPLVLIFNTILKLYLELDIVAYIVLILSSVILLILMKPKFITDKMMIQKNIDEYFENKK